MRLTALIGTCKPILNYTISVVLFRLCTDFETSTRAYKAIIRTKKRTAESIDNFFGAMYPLFQEFAHTRATFS